MELGIHTTKSLEEDSAAQTYSTSGRSGTTRSPYVDLVLECLTIEAVFVLLFLLDRSLGYLRVPLLALLLLLVASRERKVEGNTPLAFRAILAIGIGLRIYSILAFKPRYSDIVERTADAINYLRNGEDPYSVAMDLPAGTYKGYKYNPFTFLFYLLPFTASGFAGILVANLMLETAIVTLTYLAGTLLGSERTGAWASLFYAICPIAIYESINRTTIDTLPSALTLLALYYASKKEPSKAGAVLGLSIASKPFPGVPMLLLLMKFERGRKKVLLYSLTIALLLIFPFLAWSPSDFIGNIILFSAESRPLPRESIMYFLPESLESLMKPLQMLSAILILLKWMSSSDTIENTPAWCLFLTTTIIIFNHWIHRNYLLWILPYLCISWAERLVRPRH